MTFKIEKGVPLPVVKGGRRACEDYPFSQMGMGDSFYVPSPGADNAKLQLLRGRILHHASQRRNEEQADFAVTTRVEGEGVRCWRVPYTERGSKRQATAIVHRIATAAEEAEETPTPAKPARAAAPVKPKMAFDIPKFADGGVPSRVVKGSRY